MVLLQHPESLVHTHITSNFQSPGHKCPRSDRSTVCIWFLNPNKCVCASGSLPNVIGVSGLWMKLPVSCAFGRLVRNLTRHEVGSNLVRREDIQGITRDSIRNQGTHTMYQCTNSL